MNLILRTCRLALACLLSTSSLGALEVGGLIAESTTWRLADSPVHIASNSTVAAAATLTVEPGVEVRMGYRVLFTVEGNILAEGTPERPIRFVRRQANEEWRRIDLRPSPRESRFAWCEINGASNTGNISADGASLFLDHVVFTNTTSQLLRVDDTSIIVRHCIFPSIVNNELLHFDGMPPGGHALIEGCVFGTTTGYQDIIDFTGGNRPGPIARFVDNVFLAAVDDVIDLDGTDAHIEGNLFLNVRQDAVRSSSANAIASGAADGEISELTVCRNLFYNVDHLLLLKDGGRAVVQNNTVVKVAENPLDSNPIAVINWGEPNRSGSLPGGNCLFEGNLAWQVFADRFVANYQDQPFLVTHSLLPVAWPGEGNLTGLDPLLTDTNGVTAENLRAKFALLPGSPLRGAGPNGLDIGALVPPGPSVSGAPAGSTMETNLTLRVAGPGIVAYRWRLNFGPWSDEVPLTNSLAYSPTLFADARPLQLTNLTEGAYVLDVLGKNSAGEWSEAPERVRRQTWVVRHTPLTLEGPVLGAQTLTFRFQSVRGAAYRLEANANLAATGWQTEQMFPANPQSGEPVQATVAASASDTRFFRLVEFVEP